MGLQLRVIAPGQGLASEEISQRLQGVGSTVSNLADSKFEPQTSRSRDKPVTAPPTRRYTFTIFMQSKILALAQTDLVFIAILKVTFAKKNKLEALLKNDITQK